MKVVIYLVANEAKASVVPMWFAEYILNNEELAFARRYDAI